jgi:hypothetical protein
MAMHWGGKFTIFGINHAKFPWGKSSRSSTPECHGCTRKDRHVVDLTDFLFEAEQWPLSPCWLMISSGVILPKILGIIIIHYSMTWEIPY